MDSLARINGRFSIGTRIGAGFAVVLALLVSVGVLGWQSLTTSQTLFDRYGNISTNTIRAGDIRADINAVRRESYLFADSGSPEIVARIEKLAAEINQDLDDSIATILAEDRRAMAR